MKGILLIAFTVATLLTSCRKKGSDPVIEEKPATVATKISINGTEYPTVKIGTKTWTAANYNGEGGLNAENAAVNNAKYGKLYSPEEAKAIALPTGWRLPSVDDFNDLIKSFDYFAKEPILTMLPESMKKIKAKEGWLKNGDNASGFNAYPVNYAYLLHNQYIVQYKDSEADFLASNTTDSWVVYFSVVAFDTYGQNNTFFEEARLWGYPNSANYRFALRFVKDN